MSTRKTQKKEKKNANGSDNVYMYKFINLRSKHASWITFRSFVPKTNAQKLKKKAQIWIFFLG